MAEVPRSARDDTRMEAMELSRDADVRKAYSQDVSGLELTPDAVARCTSVADVIEVVAMALGERTPVTPAGSQTSTTGASITDKGILMALAGMSRVLDVDAERRIARVEPGVTIGALNQQLAT